MIEDVEHPSAEEIFQELTPQQKYHVYNIINSWLALKATLYLSQRDACNVIIKKATANGG